MRRRTRAVRRDPDPHPAGRESGRRLRPQSRHRGERAFPGVREPGDRDGPPVGRGGRADHRLRGQRPAPVLRGGDRQADGRPVGAAQPALGVPRRERRRGERLRAAGRLHLRHPRPARRDQRRGRAGVRARDTRSVTSPRGTRSSRSARQQLAQLGLGVGSILSPDLAQLAGLASQGLGVLFLKYGRDAENQADQLGFRYALQQRYDVREMDNVFITLARTSEASGAGRLPEWLSTHPDPENRVQHVKAMLDTTSLPARPHRERRDVPAEHSRAGVRRRSAPGLLRGQRLLPSRDALPADLPGGVEDPESAGGRRRGERGAGRHRAARSRRQRVARRGAPGSSSPRRACRADSRPTRPSTGIRRRRATSRRRPSRARSRASSPSSPTAGSTFGIMGYTKRAGCSSTTACSARRSGASAPLRNQAALSVQPAKLDVIRLDRQMTLEEFNRQYPSSISIEELAIINELEGPSAAIPAGQVREACGRRTGAESGEPIAALSPGAAAAAARRCPAPWARPGRRW